MRADGRACAWEAATIKGMAWPASPVATGARATRAQPASGGGCLPPPNGLFAQQEREPIRGRPAVRGKGHMVDGRDSAWRNRAPGPHAHRNTARQAMDGLWTDLRRFAHHHPFSEGAQECLDVRVVCTCELKAGTGAVFDRKNRRPFAPAQPSGPSGPPSTPSCIVA